MVFFLSVCGTIYQNLALQNLSRILPTASPAKIADLTAGTASQAYKSLSDAERALVIPQITRAMGNVWLLFLVSAALSFAFSFQLGVSFDYVTRSLSKFSCWCRVKLLLDIS
jgi:hypothetical protein